MVLSKHGLEGTGIPSTAIRTSLPQHTPVPTPPGSKCSGEGGETDHLGEQQEGRREKKVWMKAVEMAVRMREAGASQGKLGAGFWRSR